MKTAPKPFTPLLAGLTLLLMVALATTAFATDDPSETTGQTEAVDSALLTLPGSYRITSDDGIVRFPFDLYGGDIRFEGEINGHKVHMLIDDGYMWDPLLFWGSPKVDSLGFHYDGEAGIGDTSDESTMVPARTASGITISFPGVEFTDQEAYITSYNSENATMWEGSVGQVSCTFLKHFAVDINFDEMMITLIEPDKFEYTGDGVAVPWEPMGFGPFCIPATLELADGRSVTLDLFMDLGLNTQLRINQAGPNLIKAPEGSKPADPGMNIQRVVTRSFEGIIPVVKIGGYEVKDVLSGFVAEEHADHTNSEAMIGLGLLSRFNLVFDYTRRRLFVEPNKSFGDKFE